MDSKIEYSNTRLSKEAYEQQFAGKSDDGKKALALDRAWKCRDMEIELYWKRAGYFWAMIAATFAGYFLIISKEKVSFQASELLLSNIGFVLSYAWYLICKGSNQWINNWRCHIFMLEETVTGNLNKVQLERTYYSVTNINQTISGFIATIWVILTLNYFRKVLTLVDFPYIEIIILTVTVFFTLKLRNSKRKPEKTDAQSFSFIKNDSHYKTD